MPRGRDDDRLAAEGPVLRAAEAQDVDPGIRREGPQRQVEGGGGVREARAVEVQAHAARVRVVGEGTDLLGRVESAELGRLRDRHDERLRAVLVAPAPRFAVDEPGRELAVVGRHVQDLDARDALGGTALVDVDVGGGCRDDGAPPRQHRLQPRDVGARPVEDGEGLHPRRSGGGTPPAVVRCRRPRRRRSGGRRSRRRSPAGSRGAPRSSCRWRSLGYHDRGALSPLQPRFPEAPKLAAWPPQRHHPRHPRRLATSCGRSS
jgi:hypothetical protein